MKDYCRICGDEIDYCDDICEKTECVARWKKYRDELEKELDISRERIDKLKKKHGIRI